MKLSRFNYRLSFNYKKKWSLFLDVNGKGEAVVPTLDSKTRKNGDRNGTRNPFPSTANASKIALLRNVSLSG